MHALTLTNELTEIRAQIPRLQKREAALQANLRENSAQSGIRPGWPIQRMAHTKAHAGLRT